jgi:membrane fusion protein, multidrug efflux system
VSLRCRLRNLHLLLMVSIVERVVKRVLLTALAALVALAGCSGSKGTEKAATPVPEAGYVVLKAQSVPLVVELAGRTSAYETSEVRPQVSGIVRERLFNEGSFVRAGQTLYRIDPSVYRAAEAEARADLASAQATLEGAQVRAQRLKPLADMEAVSKQDYTDAVAKAREAEAAVAQVRARLEAAAINLRYTNVVAPISGRIGRSLVTTGALVTANQAQPLTSIQRLDPIFVDIQQSSSDLLALRRSLAEASVVPSSAEVRLRLEDGSDYARPGILQFTEAEVDPNTGSVVLRARFPNPDALLLPGMYVRARLSQATVRDAILVPQQGVTRDPKGQASVMIVGPDDKAIQREIQTERTVGDSWLVTGGVQSGDRVIVEGLGRVRAGAPVKPVPAGSPVSAAAAKSAGARP